MKGGFLALAILAGFVLVGGVSCSLAFTTIHARYRLTVEVQDGDRIMSGSSVIDVSYDIYPDDFVSLGGPDDHPRYVGYAPTVDLGNRGLLFMTFESMERTPAQRIARNNDISCPFSDIGCLVFAAYDERGTNVGLPYSQKKAALYVVLRKNGPRDVPFTMLPMLARLQNINAPGTLVQVSPYDLEASFGPGVRLKRVVLQLTKDPVTPPPRTWPHWLREKGQMASILKGYHND
ncbi:MAG: hypothetical protein EPN75_00310 [Beijerinckiaceae bacterium]|nr:MAG: hypothetical protein EPN75_00310 [Beijerinckiaceae bacterium]